MGKKKRREVPKDQLGQRDGQPRKERAPSLHGISLLRHQKALERKARDLRLAEEAKKLEELRAEEEAEEERERELLEEEEEETEEEETEEETEIETEEDEESQKHKDKLYLLQISDTQLSPSQILEKRLLIYNQLTASEEAGEGFAGGEKAEPKPEQLEFPGEEEPEEEEEEEIEEEEEEQHEIAGPPPPPTEPVAKEEEEEVYVDPNDPDNIIKMMMQETAEGEDEEVKLLFMHDKETPTEQEIDTVASYPGVVGLDLKPDTLAYFEIETLAEKEPAYTYISFKRIKLHVYTYGGDSEFFPFMPEIKNYPEFTMLIGFDSSKSTGHEYYLCTTLEARNLVLNPPKRKRRVAVDTKKEEEEAWNKLCSIYPRKWKSQGSEFEVDEENVKNSRPLLTIFAYRFREHFNRPIEFSDWDNSENNPNAFLGFESKDPEMFPSIETIEMDAAVQVLQTKATSSSQTGFSFKRNKMVQYENQFLDSEEVQAIMDLPVDAIARQTKTLQRILIQNEMMNLSLDDYKKLKDVKEQDGEKGPEPFCDCDIKQKTFSVTNLVFKPTLEDVVTAIFEDPDFDPSA